MYYTQIRNKYETSTTIWKRCRKMHARPGNGIHIFITKFKHEIRTRELTIFYHISQKRIIFIFNDIFWSKVECLVCFYWLFIQKEKKIRYKLFIYWNIKCSHSWWVFFPIFTEKTKIPSKQQKNQMQMKLSMRL